MTHETDAAPSPPFGDRTDEAVSAFVDGELAGFAADLGIDPDQAERRLREWPGFEARRSTLGGATLPAAPPLDEARRRELVRRAVDAVPTPLVPGIRPGPHRRRGVPRVLVAAAAAVVLVGALGVVALTVAGEGPGSSKSSVEAGRTGASASDTPPAADHASGAAAEPPDLGDVSSPAALRAALAAQGVDAEIRPPGAAVPAPGRVGAGPSSPADPAGRCAAALAGAVPGEVVFVGRGRVAERPVAVVVLEVPTRPGARAYALALPGCADVTPGPPPG